MLRITITVMTMIFTRLMTNPSRLGRQVGTVDGLYVDGLYSSFVTWPVSMKC